MENKRDFVIEHGVLTKYNGSGGDVTIPAGVTGIGLCAFAHCSSLQSVTILEGVTEIGEAAFQGCSSLQSVAMPESVTKIGPWAFDGCVSLQSVPIPAGVTKIGMSAFGGCTSLQSVPIPVGVTKIGMSAFAGCTSLQSVTIPESVTEIGTWAFGECTSLQSVNILGSAIKMGKSVLEYDHLPLIAPRIPIFSFDKEYRPGACCGFAKLYLENAELDGEIRAGYLRYIKGRRKRLFPVAVPCEELLQLMFAEKMLDHKDIDLLLEECDRQHNIAAKAAVLDYAGKNLKPVDPLKAFQLKDL